MADFVLIPDSLDEDNVKFDVLKSPKFSGLEQRRSVRDNPLHTWTLSFKKRNQTDLDYVRNFFMNHNGPIDHFTWVNLIDNVEYYVRFLDNKISFKTHQYGVYSFNVNFKQVFYFTSTTTTSTSTTTTTTSAPD